MGINDIYYNMETHSYSVEIDGINYTITPDILNAYYYNKVPED